MSKEPMATNSTMSDLERRVARAIADSALHHDWRQLLPEARAALKAHAEWWAEQEISDDVARQMLHYFNIYDDEVQRHAAKLAFRACSKLHAAQQEDQHHD